MDEELDIDLAKFNFNVDDVVKGAQELKAALDEVKKEQGLLRAEGKTSTTQFVENEVAIKALSKEYRAHIKALSDSAKGAQKSAAREKILEAVLGQEVKTIKQAREQNKVLNDLRNDANTTTEQGRQQLLQLNTQLDRNNGFIKENADQYLKQKINIGNYKDSIIEAYAELEEQKRVLEANNKELALMQEQTKEGSDEWNFYQTQINQTNTQINALIINMGGLNDEATSTGTITKLLSGDFKGLAEDAQNVGGAGNLMKGTLKGAATSLLGLAKAGVAFIATPVGAVIAALVVVFLLIRNAMDRSEETTNKLRKAFAPFEGILNAVMGALEPLGDFLVDVIVFAMEQAEQAIYKVLDAYAAAAEFFGLETIAAGIRDVNKSMQEGAQNAKDLADAEARLVKQQREARLVQLEYQKEAETLRQIRDDEGLSIAQRIQANQELGAVLEQQLQDELRIAQTALEVANLRLKAEGESAAVLDEQASALEAIADIEERINSQRSEQLTNRVSLEREAEAKRQEAISARIAKMKEEMALYIAQQGVRAQTLAQEIEAERAVSERKKAILDEELKYKKLSQEAYQTEILNLRNNLVQKEAELAVENAGREIEAYKNSLAQRQEENKFLSDQVVAQKIAENNLLLEKEVAFQTLRRDQGVIDQNEFDRVIFEARTSNGALNKEIEDERKAIEKEEAAELRAIEFEEDLERMLEEGAQRYEVEQAQQAEQRELDIMKLEEERNQGLISEQLFQARRQAIDRQAKDQELKREQILARQKLSVATGLLSAAGKVIDGESKAGKALALAQAGINTFQGISAGVKLGFPAAIPAVAYAAATGFAAVKDIAKTEVPSATGSGTVGGSGGGGASGGANLGGGANLTAIAASGNAAVQDQIEQNASGRDIANQVGQAAEAGTRAGAMQGANEGITNLTDNRRVQQESEF